MTVVSLFSRIYNNLYFVVCLKYFLFYFSAVKCKDPNEEYILAKTGEATCDNLNPLSCTPVKECRCRSGYVRYRGICIKANACRKS